MSHTEKSLRLDSPIDYLSTAIIDFWVAGEKSPLKFDINKIENFLYHDNAISIVDESLKQQKIDL